MRPQRFETQQRCRHRLRPTNLGPIIADGCGGLVGPKISQNWIAKEASLLPRSSSVCGCARRACYLATDVRQISSHRPEVV